MYKFFLKIFFLKNSPKLLNSSLIFPIFSVILSTIAFILVFSSMNSLELHFIEKIKTINGTSTLYIKYKDNNDFNIKYNIIRNFLLQNGKETSKKVEQTAIIKYFNSHKIINVIGVDNLNEKISGLGMNFRLDNFENKILIGDDLYYLLGIDKDINNRVTIFTPIDSQIIIKQKDFELLNKNYRFDNVTAFDKISENIVFIDYLDALDLFTQAQSAISINHILTENELNLLKNKFYIEDYSQWTEKYPIFFTSIRIEKILYSLFGFLLILVASFNLYGNINLIFYRKRKQFASLNFMGISSKDIKRIFHFNLLLIGFFASLVGVCISYLIVYYGLIQDLLPLAVNIEIVTFIIPFVIIFNILMLYLSSFFAMKKNIENVRSLKINAIKY